ncbi:MAG: PfkB family carbohydrate kinase [Chromatiales bacterium]
MTRSFVPGRHMQVCGRTQAKAEVRMRILGVGIATLDIINTVAGYPDEDSEVRALDQRRSRGGNATNTLTVLAGLGHACSWAGVLPEEPDAVEVERQLAHAGIDMQHVMRLKQGKMPTSCITLNTRNGSRTIIHYRDLPEYRSEWFSGVDLRSFDWLHFEGRAPAELALMLERAGRSDRRFSLEVEKPREGIERLLHLPDVLLFSKQYARANGFENAAAFLEAHARHAGQKRPLLFCSWGDAGAWALTRDDMLYHQPAFEVPNVVDTVGAGDVFNAGIIHGLLCGMPVQDVLREAARLAAIKCGQTGFDSLADAL